MSQHINRTHIISYSFPLTSIRPLWHYPIHFHTQLFRNKETTKFNMLSSNCSNWCMFTTISSIYLTIVECGHKRFKSNRNDWILEEAVKYIRRTIALNEYLYFGFPHQIIHASTPYIRANILWVIFVSFEDQVQNILILFKCVNVTCSFSGCSSSNS